MTTELIEYVEDNAVWESDEEDMSVCIRTADSSMGYGIFWLINKLILWKRLYAVSSWLMESQNHFAVMNGLQ